MPSGLGAFFSNDTLKSIGMSFEHGGLYSWDCKETVDSYSQTKWSVPLKITYINELIIGKLNPPVVPRIRLMGLMLKKNQFNIDFWND